MATSEATLLIKIKEAGASALKSIESGFGNIVSSAKKAGLAVSAFSAGVTKLAFDAGKFQQVEKAFQNLTGSVGENAEKMLESMRKATGGTISDLELMQKTNKAIMLGLPVDRFDEMMKIARSAAMASGESMDFMVDSIVTGLGRASPQILDNLGITLQAGRAYDEYAKKLGRTADQLTDTEKKQAIINKALEIGNENIKKSGEAQENTNDKFAKFTTAIRNASISIGIHLIPEVSRILDYITDLAIKTDEFVRTDFDDIRRAFELFAVDSVSVLDKFVARLVSFPRIIGEVFRTVGAAINIKKMLFSPDEFIEDIKKAALNIPDIWKESSDTIKEIENKRIDDISKLEKKHLDDLGKVKEQKINQDKVNKEKFILFQKQKEEEALRDKEELDRLLSEERSKREVADEQRKIRAIDNIVKYQEQQDKKREDAEKELFEQGKERASLITSLLSGGIKSLTSQAIGVITNVFFPGMGEAASAIFNFMTQEADKFREQLNQMFSVGFVENFVTNALVLLEELPGIIDRITAFFGERAPDFVQKFVEAFIAAMPEITSSLLKSWIAMFADPHFQGELAAAVVKGIVAGIKDAGDDIANEFKKIVSGGMSEGISGSVEGGFPTVSGGLTGSIKKAGKILGFANGGMIGSIPHMAGGGTTIDDTLVAATRGEFMVNRASTQANLSLLNAINNSNGRSVGNSGGVTIVVNGGLLGDENTARQFAKAVDEHLFKLRLGNESRAFDAGLF